MTHGISYNIIVAGLGGQGVNTLTQTIFHLCDSHGLQCHGAIFKGGAQKAGSIRSEIKVFTAARDDHARYSNQIPKGTLDLMLGLDPYEAMRYASYFNPGTRIIVETSSTPFWSERLTGLKPPDAVAELKREFRHVVARDFGEIARNEHGDPRMKHFLMLMEAADAEAFPFGAEAVRDLLGTRTGALSGTFNLMEGR